MQADWPIRMDWERSRFVSDPNWFWDGRAAPRGWGTARPGDPVVW